MYRVTAEDLYCVWTTETRGISLVLQVLEVGVVDRIHPVYTPEYRSIMISSIPPYTEQFKIWRRKHE